MRRGTFAGLVPAPFCHGRFCVVRSIFHPSNVVTRRNGSNTSARRECAAALGYSPVAASYCFAENAAMMMGTTRFSGYTVHGLAILAVALGLGACSPVDTWRDWTGASTNDPDPETTPNTKNLAAGEASDYPNLATVPLPPDRALTAAEREALTQGLVADRTNAKYSDEKLRAGFPAVSAPAPPPPPPPVPAVTDDAQAKPAAAGAPSAAAPPASPDSANAGDKTTGATGQGLRKSGEPPEPPPMESSLEIPKVRSVPN